MLYHPELREKSRQDYHPRPQIEDSHRGVQLDFFYSGQRLGTGSQIELFITSIITDWEDHVYIRNAQYRGEKHTWKQCIKTHLHQHLEDLGADKLLIIRLLRELQISKEHFRKWEEYQRFLR